MLYYVCPYFIFCVICACAQNFMRLDSDPGTYSVCWTQYLKTTWPSVPQRCPESCLRAMKMKNLDFDFVGKFSLKTSRCDCYKITNLCEDSLFSATDQNSVFYVNRKCLLTNGKNEICAIKKFESYLRKLELKMPLILYATPYSFHHKIISSHVHFT